jgi:hypothetical protein
VVEVELVLEVEEVNWWFRRWSRRKSIWSSSRWNRKYSTS